ncbi:12942_t:CDS:2, partial [Rhizophagus irregularis]
MSVDAPRDIKSIHDYVNDELMRNGHFLGPDWPDYYSDLVLEMPWFQEN